MLDRCTKPHHPRYARYGGRGIRVCERWQVFDNFYADVGDCPDPALSFDRVCNDGHYTPGNWRWATREEQSRNADTTQQTRIIHEGKPIPQWRAVELTGRPERKIQRRLGVLRKRGITTIELNELRIN